MAFRIVVLGGYGQFGARVSRGLSGDPACELLVAGRDGERAGAYAATLGARGVALDLQASDWSARLGGLSPQLVIHAAGPFQGRDYRVAQAAIACGAHYVDLADARDFVRGIRVLDAAARARGVLAVSGASTVPAITGAALDTLAARFSALESVDIGISPGNRTPRGLATVTAILGAVGRPFAWLEDGRRRRVHGWQQLVRHRYPEPVGMRWLAACDVPDLDLLPERFPGLATARFRAGLELPVLHLGLWMLSWLARWRLVGNWSRHARWLKRCSEWFESRGSDAGAMHVTVEGRDPAGRRLRACWQLVAERGDGPQIPATPALVLARALARGGISTRGARPCVGLITLGQVLAALDRFAIRVVDD